MSISSSDNTIDSRDVVKRIEELTDELQELADDQDVDLDDPTAVRNMKTFGLEDEAEELADLLDLQSQAEGYTDWRHGATLIHEDYFKKYAQEFAEDIGAVNRDANWPYTCIDWDQAAADLQQDYTGVEFAGETFYVR